MTKTNQSDTCSAFARSLVTSLLPEFLFSSFLHSYYPLYPPTEEINMDYEKFQLYGHMPVTPDILVVPSELRYFIKVKPVCCSVG